MIIIPIENQRNKYSNILIFGTRDWTPYLKGQYIANQQKILHYT